MSINSTLEGYISAEQRVARESNQVDHRPTYDAELSDIRTRCERLFEAGQTLQETLTEAEQTQCKALHRLLACKFKKGFGSDTLVEARGLDTLVIVPKYVLQIELARALQPIFSST